MPAGSEIGVKTDNWHIWELLAGPTFEIPIAKNEKISFYFDALGGILKTTIPGNESGQTYTNPPMAAFQSISKIPFAATFFFTR